MKYAEPPLVTGMTWIVTIGVLTVSRLLPSVLICPSMRMASLSILPAVAIFFTMEKYLTLPTSSYLNIPANVPVDSFVELSNGITFSL